MLGATAPPAEAAQAPAAGMPLGAPQGGFTAAFERARAQGLPMSPDIEDRRFEAPWVNQLRNDVGRVQDGWNTFKTKAKLAWIAAKGGDPNSPENQARAQDSTPVFLGSKR